MGVGVQKMPELLNFDYSPTAFGLGLQSLYPGVDPNFWSVAGKTYPHRLPPALGMRIIDSFKRYKNAGMRTIDRLNAIKMRVCESSSENFVNHDENKNLKN